jgi:hypothetical protein
MKLIGTAASDVGADGLAIIQLSDRRVQFVRPGDDVEGYLVTSVTPARVVLNKGDTEVTLELTGADPAGGPATVSAIRANFTSTLSTVYEAGWQVRQAGNAVWFLDSMGRPEASFPIPEALVGEEFAPAGEIPSQCTRNSGGAFTCASSGR